MIDVMDQLSSSILESFIHVVVSDSVSTYLLLLAANGLQGISAEQIHAIYSEKAIGNANKTPGPLLRDKEKT